MSPVTRIVKNLSWLTVGEVSVRAAFLVVLAIVARGMGPSELGVFTVALNGALVAIPFLLLGQAEVLIRAVAGRPARAGALLGSSLRLQHRLLRWVVPMVCLALLVGFDAPLRWAGLALVPYVWLRVETATRAAVFKGLDRMEVEVHARLREAATAVTGTLVAAAVGLASWAAGLALSLGAALGLHHLTRTSRELENDENPGAGRSSFSAGLPFVSLALALQLVLRGDVLLMGALGLPAERIGYYGIASGLTWGLLAAPQMLAIALYPTFSRRALGGRTPAADAWRAAGLGAALGTSLAGVAWWLRAPLVRLLFGTEYQPATEALAVLLMAFPGASISMVVGTVVAAWHRQWRGLGIWGCGLAALLILDFVWIPEKGIVAAAAVAAGVHTFLAVGSLAVATWPRPRTVGDLDTRRL